MFTSFPIEKRSNFDILKPMLKRMSEPTLLVLLFGIAYFTPLSTAALPVFYDEFNTVDGSLYASRFFDVLISAGLVLMSSRLLIPSRMNWASLGRATLVFLSILMLGSIIEYGWDRLVLVAFNLPTGPGEVSDKILAYPQHEMLNLTIIQGNLAALIAGIFYGLIRDRSRQIRQREELERQTLESEVNYLRSQINPHFLFYTLNNIYANTQRNADHDGSDALLRLSGLMRYMLYDSAGGTIGLQQEVEHLQNYLDLMLLKYKPDDPPDVKMDVHGTPDRCSLAPLLLLPFVENAFKHGIDNQGQGKIRIDIQAYGSGVVFRVVNSRIPQREASSEHRGIGLENVRQRLEHLYPEKHELKTRDDDDEYRVELRIEL